MNETLAKKAEGCCIVCIKIALFMRLNLIRERRLYILDQNHEIAAV